MTTRYKPGISEKLACMKVNALANLRRVRALIEADPPGPARDRELAALRLLIQEVSSEPAAR